MAFGLDETAGGGAASAFWTAALAEGMVAAAGLGTAFAFWAIETPLSGSAVTAEGEKVAATGQEGDAASQKVVSGRQPGIA
ncbi:hypothetical protein [Prosthecobacter sp.]|uniref:hypothetical protein n=1 Tax=Prosthecobacter sp. TaxID=1965333 RepID=UPI002ABA1BD1|nr:hypothetical protein [Prosthecobacter sp.]MDZ4403225.1 hypothetical protein [Prosthecobacter sp.]